MGMEQSLTVKYMDWMSKASKVSAAAVQSLSATLLSCLINSVPSLSTATENSSRSNWRAAGEENEISQS